MYYFPSSTLPKKAGGNQNLPKNHVKKFMLWETWENRGRWKRFYNGVNDGYSLKKLQTQKKYYISNSLRTGSDAKFAQGSSWKR